MATATRSLVDTLTDAFTSAREAAIAASQNPEDGGTCNMDSPAFHLKGVRDSVIQEAAQRAGVTCNEFRWFGGRRWYWLHGCLQGQGNLRSRMSYAATKALETAGVPGMKVCEYCQCD